MTTVLTPEEAPAKVKEMLSVRSTEAERLDRIFEYLRDPDADYATQRSSVNGPLRWLKAGVPADVRRLAEMSRVNMLAFVVNAATQVMYVDGYRAPTSEEEDPAWVVWKSNRLAARQIGVHRSTLSYGASYVTVLPGEGSQGPVIRGASPRKMTAVYGDDDDWPEYALEKRRSAVKGKALYRLYDAMSTFWVYVDEKGNADLDAEYGQKEHGVGYTPIVRFLSEIDEDDIIQGDVEPLITLQDQINMTTFELLVAQHFGAFRQRYIMGWMAETETEALKVGADKLMLFEDPDVKVGEFAQTDLKGYIDSREASLRHLATTSQTPAHELLGQLVNLSAEALDQVEASFRRKIDERQTTMGESWEQVLELAAKLGGETSDPMASVRWRDTQSRSLAQVADALGKMTEALEIPKRETWEMIPGVTQQQLDRWKKAADEIVVPSTLILP